jgi:hypothetical protein
MNNTDKEFVKANLPDKWTGWRHKEDGSIDYGLDDKEYLSSRAFFIMHEVLDSQHSEYNITNLDKDSGNNNRVIANWGCGSGKTNKIKMFTINNNQPMIIVVKSNEEVDKLVFDITALNPNKSVIGFHKFTNSINKIEEDPDYLSNFQILVTNLKRLFDTPIPVLFDYIPKKTTIVSRSISNISNIRKYLIIDELPQFYQNITRNYLRMSKLLLNNNLVKDTVVLGIDTKTKLPTTSNMNMNMLSYCTTSYNIVGLLQIENITHQDVLNHEPTVEFIEELLNCSEYNKEFLNNPNLSNL